MKKLSPYQRIVRNAKEARGVNLSAYETCEMALDSAILELAAHDDAMEKHDDRPA